MANVNYMSCCGVKEVSSIGQHHTSEEALRSLLRAAYDDLPAHFIFTQARYVNRGRFRAYGDQLMKYIRDNKLGSVVRSGENRNPNTGAMIATYVWKVSSRNTQRWFERHGR